MAKMTKTQQRRALERINSTTTKLYFSQSREMARHNQFMSTTDLLAINKIVTKCLKKL